MIAAIGVAAVAAIRASVATSATIRASVSIGAASRAGVATIGAAIGIAGRVHDESCDNGEVGWVSWLASSRTSSERV